MSKISTVGYNADDAAAARAKRGITLGGREFFPQKRTVKVMEDLAKVAPEAFGLKEFNKEDPIAEMRVVNAQINALVKDADGEEPGIDFLNEELDLEDGYRLLELLSPKVEEEVERARD
jgi:hypothetical protein